ncbi:MAG: hypothetical protein ING77_02170 [Rhodocyclaceae bacterium]|nr:hypothetical protein [Rhodocyclaceae bacterium]MCA3093584.1 hypothetical protein [Rhodocyclaceae bacterium]MCA3149968.1 hypothetical protein [Rhodocyclaceae bacterium]
MRTRVLSLCSIALATDLASGPVMAQTRQARATLEVRATVVRVCTVGIGVTSMPGCEAVVRENQRLLERAPEPAGIVRASITEQAADTTAPRIIVRTFDF